MTKLSSPVTRETVKTYAARRQARRRFIAANSIP